MPQWRDDAVCIRHWDFSETSQTVSLLCRSHGLVRGLAKGARREKGKFSGGIQLLTRGEILAIGSPTRDLATLTEWNLLESFSILHRNLAAHRAALYFADLLHHMVTDLDPHPSLYDSLLTALRSLAPSDATPTMSLAYRGASSIATNTPPASSSAVALLHFQWSLLHNTGYRPTIDRDVQTGQPLGKQRTLAFSPIAGGIVADTRASDRWRVRRETIDLLASLDSDPSTPTMSVSRFVRSASPLPLREGVGGGSSAQALQPAALHPKSLDRANRLLAAYLRAILDRELPTMTALFGPLKI